MKKNIFISLITILILLIYQQVTKAQGDVQKVIGYAEVYGSYNELNKLNQEFFASLKNKEIVRNVGIGIGTRVIYKLFFLDAFMTEEDFLIKSTFHPSESKFKSNTYSCSGNIFLLPQIKDYFTTYVGIGYTKTYWTLQYPVTNSQGVIQKKDGKVEYEDIDKIRYSHVFWNVGIRGKINRVSLTAVYMQSFNTNQDHGFSQFSISLGYNFWVFKDEY